MRYFSRILKVWNMLDKSGNHELTECVFGICPRKFCNLCAVHYFFQSDHQTTDRNAAGQP